MRVQELSEPLTSCSSLESGPCPSPGQHSGAGPGGVGVSAPTAALGGLAPAVPKSSPWWCDHGGVSVESWRADYLSFHAGADPGLSELAHRNICPIDGVSEGASPTDSRLQDLHDTGQQQDI